MLIMKPCPGIRVRKIYIPSGARRVPALVLSPEELSAPATGVLWIHGGGYISGMKEMVYISRAGLHRFRRTPRRSTTAIRRWFI